MDGLHMDALWERTESLLALIWLAHGCFVGFVGVNMVGTWML